MKTKILPVLLLALAATGCFGGRDDVILDPIDEATLLVVNESDFAIVELYITDAGSPDWGPNQLGGDVLLPLEEILLADIPCGFYDTLIVAEDGLECELLDVDLCLDDRTWFITNDTCAEIFKPRAAAD